MPARAERLMEWTIRVVGAVARCAVDAGFPVTDRHHVRPPLSVRPFRSLRRFSARTLPYVARPLA
jgi:hypothetical protein